jgi:methionyl-tRNA formyltransferase
MSIRTVFFGTPLFAIPTLQRLIDAPEIELTGVVTPPDRPAGRGKKLSPPPVKELAQHHQIEVFQPETVKQPEVLSWLEGQKADVLVVVAYGGFIPKPIRECPPYGCINLHPSLLPRYRGAAPMQWAIMNGEEVTGNTTMYLSAGWDDGDIIYQEKEPIFPDDDYGTLSERLSGKGAHLVLRSLIDIANGTAPRIPQPAEGIVMAPMIQNEECRIDWRRSTHEIYNHIRGLTPIPGAFTLFEEKRWKISKTEIVPEKTSEAEPGTILSTEFNTIRVAAGDGILEILELQPAGKKRMKASEFLRGMQAISGKLS